MDTSAEARSLLHEAHEHHEALISQARAVSSLRDLLGILVECISFAEKHLPSSISDPWLTQNAHVPVLVERSRPLFTGAFPASTQGLFSLATAASSADSDAFSFIAGSFNFLEDDDSRQEYYGLAGTFRDLLAGPEQQEEVHIFLAPLNVVADSKFRHSIEAFQALPFTRIHRAHCSKCAPPLIRRSTVSSSAPHSQEKPEPIS